MTFRHADLRHAGCGGGSTGGVTGVRCPGTGRTRGKLDGKNQTRLPDAARLRAGRLCSCAGKSTAQACAGCAYIDGQRRSRSEEHTSELQSLMRISYAVFCLKKKTIKKAQSHNTNQSNNHKTNTTE